MGRHATCPTSYRRRGGERRACAAELEQERTTSCSSSTKTCGRQLFDTAGFISSNTTLVSTIIVPTDLVNEPVGTGSSQLP